MSFMKFFLKELCPILKGMQPKFENDDKRNNVAIIIEPRKIEMLEAVIRNTIFCLPYNEWNLHVFHSKANESYIKSILPNWSFKMTNILDKGENINADQYNQLFKKKHFWNKIKEENILIFQHDSAILHSNILPYMNYPFIGSPLLNNLSKTPKNFGMNGGLSFRKRTVMLECIDKVTSSDVNNYRIKYDKKSIFDNVCGCPIEEVHECSNTIKVIPEDVYFSHAVEILGYKTPSFPKSLEFSSDEYINHMSFGMHGFQYGRIPKKDLVIMIKNSMLRNIYFMNK